VSPLATWWLLVSAALRAEFQYRVNVVISVLAGLCYQGIGLACIVVVLDRFGTLAGWGVREVAFLYAIRLTGHGLWLVPFNQLLTIDEIVREGHFDRFLTRPGNPLIYFMTYRTSLLPMGDLLGGLTLLTVTSVIVPVSWTPWSVAFLVLAVVGAGCTELSIQLTLASLTFRMLSTQALRLVVDTVFGTFGGYPIKIFSGAAQMVMTFGLPLAFVGYLPASVLLDRTGELHVPAWLALASPAVGVGLLTGAGVIWSRQLRGYQSAGH
jgi:ABC-2 type transport system permease protein